jgi:hypothetical protein
MFFSCWTPLGSTGTVSIKGHRLEKKNMHRQHRKPDKLDQRHTLNSGVQPGGAALGLPEGTQYANRSKEKGTGMRVSKCSAALYRPSAYCSVPNVMQ